MSFPTELPVGLLVDGVWSPSSDGATIDVVDPATELVVASVPSATPSDVARAIDAAVAGQAEWARVDAWSRSRALRKVADTLREWAPRMAEVMTAEQGKPLAEATGELLATADQFDWYADEARRIYGRTVDGHHTNQRLVVRREPVGVVAAFSAWNFPALLASRKLAPALAAGCAVIVKPAEEAPLTMFLIAQACLDAGVTPGAISVLTGDPAAISDQLVSSPKVDKISLTGSVPVGRILMRAAAEGIKPVSMELGGHAPVLVFADADLDAAAKACVAAKFRNAGQVCASPSRFLVQEPAVAEFTAAFVKYAGELKVGAGTAPDTTMGPLTNARRVEAARALVDDAVAKGATVAYGGEPDPEWQRGFFFPPTVLTDVPSDASIMSDEPFAPVAPITTFTDLQDALAIANSTEFGLASFVFTNDLRTAHLASEGIRAGMVGVNTMLIATAEAPFGGIRSSGFGREGGSEGVLDYTHAKYVNFSL